MPVKTTKTEHPDIKDVSRNTCTCTREIHEDGNTIDDLYTIVIAGSLQRIATALESIAFNSDRIYNTLESISIKKDEPNNYELRKQVAKLTARLKAKGRDADPDTDNRYNKK